LLASFGLVVPSSSAQTPGPAVTLSTTAIDFGTKRVATPAAAQEIILTNTGGAVLTLSDMALKGPKDFDLYTNCVGAGSGGKARRLVPGSSCKIFAVFTAASSGVRNAVVTVQDDAPAGTQMISLTGTGTQGYYVAGAAGEVTPSGDAIPFGAAANLKLGAPVVGLAATLDGDGYWLLGRDGGIFAYGDATFRGSTGGMHLNHPVIGMAATPSGIGYWLVASDGGIFAFGDAGFYGSTGKMTLNSPIVGMAATPTGLGYWLVASDGGIFAFGDAGFYGSTGKMTLNNPIVGMAATPTGLGYWFVASDGGIFAFGDAGYYGSTGKMTLSNPIVGMAATPSGLGYWFVASDGGIFAFGDAPFLGRFSGQNDIIGLAPTARPLPLNLLPAP
jgi:ribosomal protein L24E